MKKILIVTLTLFVLQSLHSQKSYIVGFNIGVGKNYFANTHETDNGHFSFNDPLSIGLGVQFVKIIDPKNHIVAQFNYISKKISFDYNLNEREIPYNLNQTVTDKYDCLALSIGFRKPLQLKKVNLFAQIDLAADYNIYVAQSDAGNGSGTNIDFTDEILYESFLSNNLGQKSITLGSNIALGVCVGKRRKSEIAVNLNIPFNKIQNRTSTLQYVWSYQGKDYYHNLDYKGSIIYPSVKYTYNAFTK